MKDQRLGGGSPETSLHLGNLLRVTSPLPAPTALEAARVGAKPSVSPPPRLPLLWAVAGPGRLGWGPASQVCPGRSECSPPYRLQPPPLLIYSAAAVGVSRGWLAPPSAPPPASSTWVYKHRPVAVPSLQDPLRPPTSQGSRGYRPLPTKACFPSRPGSLGRGSPGGREGEGEGSSLP